MSRLCCSLLLITSAGGFAAETGTVTAAPGVPAAPTVTAAPIVSPTPPDARTTPVASSAPAFGVEAGVTAYQPVAGPLDQGFGVFLALRFPVGVVQTGYRVEKLELHSISDDNHTGLSDDAKYEIDLHELLLERQLLEPLAFGMSAGVARVKASIAINGDGGPVGVLFREQAPTGDLYLRYRILHGGERADASLNLTTGYRFLWFRASDPDTTTGTDYDTPVSNFSGFHLGISILARF